MSEIRRYAPPPKRYGDPTPRTAEKQFQPPQAKPNKVTRGMDADTRHFNASAERYENVPGVVLLWYGDPDTGRYDGFRVLKAGRGRSGE